MKFSKWIYFLIIFIFIMNYTVKEVYAQESKGNPELDKKVMDFLKVRKNSWQDMNVTTSDGQLLFDIIVKNNYKKAIEIGTSTGHSGIWIAWALSKTGGKLITLEINEERYKEALANFEKAGIAQYVEAHFVDAHKFVPNLNGPIDFVFSDADKDWYINYFKAINPKLIPGGCFTAHNFGMPGVIEYYEYINKLPNYKTSVDKNGGGMIISYKTSER